MTFDDLTDKLPILTGGFLAIGVLLFLLATRQFRRSRSASFWLQRRRAGQRGLQVSLISIFFLAVGSILCVVTFVLRTVEEDDPTPVAVANTATDEGNVISSEALPVTVFMTETPTITAASTETPTDLPTLETETHIPTETINTDEAVQIDETAASDLPTEVLVEETPTVLPTETSTPEPIEVSPETPTDFSTETSTATMTATPTLSPTETLIIPTNTPTLTSFPVVVSQIMPAVARVIPSEDAQLTVTGIATTVDIDINPIEMRDSFRTGFRRLYFFMEFEDMETGVLWRWALYRDGEFVDGQSLLWGVLSEGETYFFLGDDLGFVPGTYELQLYLGDNAEPINHTEFSVTN